MRISSFILTALLGSLLSGLADSPLVWADDAAAGGKVSPEHLRFFETEVRPLLVRRCLECHSADKAKGDLRLDTRAGMLKGGESGDPAIQPGRAAESPLVQAIRYESLEMPPAGKLPEREIAILTKWVEIGAPWPGTDTDLIRREDSDKITEEDRAWWAFRPLAAVEPPAAREGESAHPIDRFLRERLRRENLAPAPETDRTTLIRRLTLDLTGLPPTPAEVQAFVADPDPKAYEKLVDSLLARPQYGERWARHWLDLVRYADSDGYRIDHYRPQSWRYRDYVIASLNADKPYDRFVQEQLAGDELFPGDSDALVATGYLRHWIYEYNSRDAKGQWSIILNDITDNVGDVFLGVGMQCARCHDHKYDPILQKDYFRLQAFFAGLMPRDTELPLPEKERREYEAQLATWEAATAEVRKEIDALEAPVRASARKGAVNRFPDDIQAIYWKPASERTTYENQLSELIERQVQFDYERLDQRFKGEQKEKLLALRKQLAAFDKLRPAPRAVAMIATDDGPVAAPTAIPGHKSEPVAPGFLTILDPAPARVATPEGRTDTTGRRSALARWLTSPDNPLTARIVVNRVWQQHFGRGLAANVSDFGKLGEPPTHPELLDWLATQFVRDGWSLKRLHRLIVTSSSYRQSTAHPEFARASTIDPENRLLWRAGTRRLDAEQIRDSILAASGELKLDAGGPGQNGDSPRRTIYVRQMRNARDPLLDAFDLPQFFASEASRNTTTTPVQSLMLINSPQLLRHASQLAGRVWGTKSTEMQTRVEQAWWHAYGRAPTHEETSSSLAFLAQQIERISAGTPQTTTTDIATGKLPYRDGQALLIATDAKKRLRVPHDPQLSGSGPATADGTVRPADFTVEAFFQLRSIYDGGNVRTIVSKWTGATDKPGWSLGVTGKGSRRKPQTLVFQLHGNRRVGAFGEQALFSDHHVELNKPYYVGAVVRLATAESPGSITFHLKDLSDDDQPLSTVTIPHDVVSGFQNEEPLAIGCRSVEQQALFDGLIDDVRLSRGTLAMNQLLLTVEGMTPETIGYWQFEVEPGVLQDTTPNHFDIRGATAEAQSQDPTRRAFVDFCHALLNSNEFLYVH